MSDYIRFYPGKGDKLITKIRAGKIAFPDSHGKIQPTLGKIYKYSIKKEMDKFAILELQKEFDSDPRDDFCKIGDEIKKQKQEPFEIQRKKDEHIINEGYFPIYKSEKFNIDDLKLAEKKFKPEILSEFRDFLSTHPNWFLFYGPYLTSSKGGKIETEDCKKIELLSIYTEDFTLQDIPDNGANEIVKTYPELFPDMPSVYVAFGKYQNNIKPLQKYCINKLYGEPMKIRRRSEDERKMFDIKGRYPARSGSDV